MRHPLWRVRAITPAAIATEWGVENGADFAHSCIPDCKPWALSVPPCPSSTTKSVSVDGYMTAWKREDGKMTAWKSDDGKMTAWKRDEQNMTPAYKSGFMTAWRRDEGRMTAWKDDDGKMTAWKGDDGKMTAYTYKSGFMTAWAPQPTQ